MEQTSHHPLVSHFLIDGQNGNYKLTGWSQNGIKVGVNTCNLHALGHKEITFKDGQRIRFNNTGDYVFNILMGAIGHQLTGKITLTDEENQIKGMCFCNFDKQHYWDIREQDKIWFKIVKIDPSKNLMSDSRK